MSKQKNETLPRGKTLFSTAISHLLPGEKHIPRERRVFVNRNLRMEGVRALGFDMDHTLALYHRAPFEQLTHDLALQNLVEWRGYPESIRSIHYNPDCIIRGLIVDKRHGNILKMDFHGYIAKAMHGSHVLDRDERKKLYRRSRVNLRSDRYQSFDTLFSMPEGSLYSALMDLRSRKPESEFSHLKPNQIFDDVRASVDKAHRDGSLKSIIVKDLSRYFVWDPDLAATLLRFRALGKKVFLLTNSEHSYTEAVMNYLLGQAEGNWKQLFDLVVVSAGKPGFFLEKSRPEGIPTPECPGREEFCFSGGNASWVERFLGANGDQVLYFGDHTYGDILKSKKKVGWRTAMIVQELEQEVAANRRLLYQRRELNGLMARQQDLALDRDHLRFLLETLDGNGEGGALSAGGKALLLSPAGDGHLVRYGREGAQPAPGGDATRARRARLYERPVPRAHGGTLPRHHGGSQPLLGQPFQGGKREQPVWPPGAGVRLYLHQPGVQFPGLLGEHLLHRPRGEDAP